jgi:hypothetical protein
MNPRMCKTSLYRKRTLALSLIYPVHALYYSPPWVWLDLLSTYVHSCLVFTEKDPNFVPEDVE